MFADRPAWMQEEFFKQAADPALFEMLNSEDYRKKVESDPATELHRAALKTAMKNLKKLRSAHALVAFGTDSGATPQRVQGFDEHRELRSWWSLDSNHWRRYTAPPR